MTEELFEDFLDKFPNCPNPQHSPETVKYLLKLYKYYYSSEKRTLTTKE